MPLVELPGFEEAVARESWTGSTALVPFAGQRHCRKCNAGTVVAMPPVTQLALFYHSGYGAAEELTIDVCLACSHVSIRQVSTRNPRKYS
jgi:hypothetical protein